MAVATERVPLQRVGYPLWPYHAAWNPALPSVAAVGGGIPGPIDATQGPADGAGVGAGPDEPGIVSGPTA